MSVFVDQTLKVHLFCKDEDGDALDLTGVGANITMLSLDPAGTETAHVVVIEDILGGEISYTFPIDVLTAGQWLVKGYLNAEQIPGARVAFLVVERWDA